MKAQQRIPVFKTVSLGISFVVRHALQILLMLLQAAFVAFTLAFAFEKLFSDLAAKGVFEIAFGLVLCPIAVAIHREIILDEPIFAKNYFRSFATSRVWKFWGFGIAASICGALLAGFGSLAVAALMNALSLHMGPLIGILLLGIFNFIAALIIARFAFTLPAVATDQFDGIWSAKRMMSGNYWRVIGALSVVGFIVAIFNSGLMFMQYSSLPGISTVVVMYAVGTGMILSMLVMPAVLSFAYSSLCEPHQD